MAELDPTKPQVTDPVTVADLARLLSIRGSLGVLDVADIIVPTISVGSLAPISVAIRQPAYRSTDVFSAGVLTAAAAGAIQADTTALPAGTYDVQLYMLPSAGLVGPLEMEVQHRDAADAATLAVWTFLIGSGVDGAGRQDQNFAYELANNERLRIVNIGALGAGDLTFAVIFARIRE